MSLLLQERGRVSWSLIFWWFLFINCRPSKSCYEGVEWSMSEFPDIQATTYKFHLFFSFILFEKCHSLLSFLGVGINIFVDHSWIIVCFRMWWSLILMSPIMLWSIRQKFHYIFLFYNTIECQYRAHWFFTWSWWNSWHHSSISGTYRIKSSTSSNLFRFYLRYKH